MTGSTRKRRWAHLSVWDSHRSRVHGFVERGTEEGAEVVAGGRAPEGPGAYHDGALAAVDNSMTVAQQEIFGPVVTVIPFEDEAEAVRLANDVSYGLMATVSTGDPARGHRLVRQIKSGTVGINMPYAASPGYRSAATNSPASAASSASTHSRLFS